MCSFVSFVSLTVSARCLQVALLLLCHIPLQVPLFILSIDGHLSCYQFGAVVINATVNIIKRVSWWIYALLSLWYFPEIGIAESLDTLSGVYGKSNATDKISLYFWKTRFHLFYNINPVTFGKGRTKKRKKKKNPTCFQRELKTAQKIL